MARFNGLLIALICAAFLTTCGPSLIFPNKLTQIRHRGQINVLTRFDPTTYYESAEGFTGLEHDLITLFAQHLGVKANFITPETFNSIIKGISNAEADIAAAGLTVTAQRKRKMRFAPSYQLITEQIIYRSGNSRPRKIDDLNEGILEVVKSTSHIETLLALKRKHPELTWNTNSDLDTDSLLYLVNEGLIDYTVADSNQAALIRQFYPKLKVAFNLTDPRELAWAFPHSTDNSLYYEAKRFFYKIKTDQTLAQLLDKHYAITNRLNYVGHCKFRLHRKNRLPKYQKYFEAAAKKYNLDWRLLAAIGYQESHWLANAKSPTGVRGIMMLTQNTAELLDIENRIDPKQSITGGTRYFYQRLQKLPKRIKEPDRTWLALASYNVGFGHLEDARILTQKAGGNPDKWIDVKRHLPLLSRKKWYKQTKHGYARGKEPVRYVENIRSYYNLLVWLTEEDKIEQNAMNTENDIENKALEINPPAL